VARDTSWEQLSLYTDRLCRPRANPARRPSYALYRFTMKLRTHKPLLEACLDRVTASLRAELPEYGRDVAIDASDLPAYANGQRYVSKNGPERERFSDPDASWGHRSAVSTRKGGGFYGYRLHAAVCAVTGLPVAWEVKSAREHESLSVVPLLDTLAARGFAPETAALDKGYDIGPVYEACEAAGADPARDEAVALPLPGSRRRRARVRTLKARLRPRAASHSRD